MFIHRPQEERGKPLTSPPSMSAVMGYYTENESWGGGAFHEGYWRRDTIRYRGFLGYVSMNLTYYPPELSEHGIGLDFNIEGAGLIQRLDLRIKNTPWFLGAEYVFFKNTVEFKLTQEIPEFEGGKQDFRLGSLGALGYYDSRDFNFTTNRGYYSQVKFEVFSEVFGSDEEFRRFSS